MNDTVAPIPYDRGMVRVGIVHFGVGNFHRSHQAMYIDRLLRDPATFSDARTWGICGVGVLPGDLAMRDALSSQDFSYTLVERPPNGLPSATTIGSIVDYLYAPRDIEKVLSRLADPNVRVVSLTITEGGYNISDSTGQFDRRNPAIVADAQPGAIPRTAFGMIVAGIKRRRDLGLAPFTVMSCDNVEGNGSVARRSIVEFARMIDPELAVWIDSAMAFPNSMVDRITPTTTDDDRDWVKATFGVQDAWPVLCEDFVQWVLEDDFTCGRPPLDKAGVTIVEDVRPYELMKLRLLNAGHQALAYSGLLAGYEYAHEAAADNVLVSLVREYMDRDATPTLEAVPGVDLESYKDQLIERFGNPHIFDTLARLATDTSDRIPKFLVPVVRERRSSGNRVPLSAAIVASWAAYAERFVTLKDVPFRDRQEAAVREAVTRSITDPAGFLRNADWFGDLAEDSDFVEDYLRALERFRSSRDPREAIRSVLDGEPDGVPR
jgi:mannitol 2-dehydrogenase